MRSVSTISLTPQCQIVVFNWVYNENLEDLSIGQLSQTEAFDISIYIKEVSFSKSLASPTGSFSITLHNNRDWKDFIQPGSWCLIYMSNNGGLSLPRNSESDFVNIKDLQKQSSKLRCIGYIDTVRAVGSVGLDKGELDVNYNISGRDLGVVYEETDIYHNTFTFDSKILTSFASKLGQYNNSQTGFNRVDILLKLIHELFFSPSDVVSIPKGDSLTSLALQWLLPSQLLHALAIQPKFGTPYFGNIPDLFEFTESPCGFPIENPLNVIEGNAWMRLKAHSIEPFHELFLELNEEGQPRLIFRPIPWILYDNEVLEFPEIWNIADFIYQNNILTLTSLDILSFDIGSDDFSRYNMFYANPKTTINSNENAVTLLKEKGFPRTFQNSIRRHGLRKMFVNFDANVSLGEKINPDLIVKYNKVLVNYWKNAHSLESGSMSIIGSNLIKLGKVLYCDSSVSYNNEKYFYLEGYTDTFIVDENGSTFWTQDLIITRGIEGSKIGSDIPKNQRSTIYKNKGNFTDK